MLESDTGIRISEEDQAPGEQGQPVESFIHPLDRRDGRIPSWSEISVEFKLTHLPRGKRRLWQSFYRSQRLFAQGRKKKGRKLINALDNISHFAEFEKEHADTLTLLAKRVRGKGVSL